MRRIYETATISHALFIDKFYLPVVAKIGPKLVVDRLLVGNLGQEGFRSFLSSNIS